ncbi:hypothetical protein [Providencia sneebia]|uniref:Lipoprotein n=1 Tax=Providencia sneebia DSM 19967 TaxID=1141660 RepID=K8WLQ8_9GAMM|nr:hypothetical protein [Providencia sneebia]EKT60876.1 hypothetical protein OO7_02256 [Providencia sneebia DSM 19967]
MKSIEIKKQLNLSVYLLLLITLASACSQKSIHNNTHEQLIKLEGYIDAKYNNIPKDSIIILSIAPFQQEGNHSIHDYRIITKTANSSIAFHLFFPKSLLDEKNNLGISIRVERNNKIIMMSKNIIPLPRNFSEKIYLDIINMI